MHFDVKENLISYAGKSVLLLKAYKIFKKKTTIGNFWKVAAEQLEMYMKARM